MTPSEVILQRWDAAAAKGALRTSADGAQWRLLTGALGVVVMFNPLHRSNKRPVAAELAATAAHSGPPTKSAFNFTKARPIEFLCGLHTMMTASMELTMEDLEAASDWYLPRHAVLVNVSPLMRGHILFVFDLNALHPQAITPEMLHLAVGVGHLVNREDLALGFNSAGAWSSVNHCHFQGYWMNEIARLVGQTSSAQFPVVLQERDTLFQVVLDGAQVIVSRPIDWPMRCFAIEQKLPTDVRTVIRVTWELVRILQTQGIPHNILLVWRPHLLVFVFPRQRQQENGIGHFATADSSHQLRFAVAEVAGLVVAGNQSVFNEFSESIYQDIMQHEISLDQASFSALAQLLRNSF